MEINKIESTIRYNPNFSDGLNSSQVESRIAKGFTNVSVGRVSKSNFSIVRDYVFTLFNLFNLAIGIALAIAGAFSSLLFLVVVVLNITIGIVQEIRGRNMVNKLTLLHASKVWVIRNGIKVEVATDEVVLDDIMVLSAGEQITADSIVVEGSLEVNEALLTGESDTIVKNVGNMLLSGSFVVSGIAKAKVEKVGVDGFANKLALDAKVDKKQNSYLIKSMRKVTNLTSFFIIPIGILLFVQAFFIRDNSWQEAVPLVSGALLGMLPRGLVLLVSIALAAGVIKLSKKQVLVQDLYATETLARVNVLCLDKTGTITEGKMSVSNVQYININAQYRISNSELTLEDMVRLFLEHSDDNNQTATALREHFVNKCGRSLNAPTVDIEKSYSHFENNLIVRAFTECLSDINKDDNSLFSAFRSPLKLKSKIPFSSIRKWSSVTIQNLGTIIIGAPDILSKHSNQKINLITSDPTSRMLYVAFSKNEPLKNQLNSLEVIGGIELLDPIRKNATETLAYFKKEGVDVKIISGDSLETVGAIAKKAGLENWASVVDMNTITTEQGLQNASKKYSIFTRVSPNQKQQLVKAFKNNGDTVAMVGDGVNDVLALREADCSIALAEGSSASKQVSSIVLLNSDFTHLPAVVNEGRRVVNNVTKAGGIFFIKTIYSVLLSILLIIINAPFPFLPVQIAFIDLAIEGFPSFFLSFENETQKIKGNFLNTAFIKALPHAIMIVVAVAVLFILNWATVVPQEQINGIAYIVLGFISLAAVFRACMPPNKLRVFLMGTAAIGFFVAVYLFSYGIAGLLGIDFNFLHLVLERQYLWIAIVLCVAILPILVALFMWIRPKSMRNDK